MSPMYKSHVNPIPATWEIPYKLPILPRDATMHRHVGGRDLARSTVARRRSSDDSLFIFTPDRLLLINEP